MANFLKLNKSYLGPEVLSNGSFEGYGPELIANGDFSSGLSGWTGNDFAAELSIVNDKIRVTNGDESAAGFTSINGVPTLSVVSGKTYEIKYESFQGTSSNAQSQLFLGTIFNTGNVLSGTRFQTNGIHSYIFTAASTQDLYLLIKTGTVTSGAYMEFDNISVKQVGIVELVSDGNFTDIADGTAVITLPQWSTNNLSSANIQSSVLQAISSSGGQLVKLNIPTVIGTEYKFNVASVTGDLADNSIAIWNVNGLAAVDVDVTSGSGSLTFVADGTSTVVNFYAGNRSGAKQTNYANISLQATNQFAYGYERFGTNNAGGQNSVFDLQAKTVRFIAATTGFNHIAASDNFTATNQEYLLKIDVESIVGTSDFIWYNGSGYYRIKLKLGENEFRYTRQGTNSGIYFGIDVDSAADIGSSFTLNSISLQEVVNQPKLIGVDNVSMVSAPTDNTVVINNGLTDGADNLTITYAGASASLRVQMRNFFQDSIIRLANGNNTAEVLEITPPVLITDIVAS